MWTELGRLRPWLPRQELGPSSPTEYADPFRTMTPSWPGGGRQLISLQASRLLRVTKTTRRPHTLLHRWEVRQRKTKWEHLEFEPAL